MLLPAGLNTNFHKLMDAAEGLLHMQLENPIF